MRNVLTVAEREFGKPLDRLRKSDERRKMELIAPPVLLRIIAHRTNALKKISPAPTELEIQGVSARATRMPRMSSRPAVLDPLRSAERTHGGLLPQPPPRTVREPQSPVVQAEPSAGAPL